MAYTSKSTRKNLATARKQYNIALKKGNVGTYSNEIAGLASSLAGRQRFEYDPSRDAAYTQLQKQYQQNGQLAMADTVAQTAALTGGFGNSYGQVAGQQVYNDYMKQATDKIPELMDAAYTRYQDKGNEMMNQLSMYQSLAQDEYQRSQDAISNAYNNMAYLQGVADNEKNFNYQKESDNRNYALSLLAANNAAKKSSSKKKGKSGLGSLGSLGSVGSLGDSGKTVKTEKTATKDTSEKDMLNYKAIITGHLRESKMTGGKTAELYINSLYNNGKISKAQREVLRNYLLDNAKNVGALLGTDLGTY